MDVRFYWTEYTADVPCGHIEQMEIVNLETVPRVGEFVEINFETRCVWKVIHVTNNTRYSVSPCVRIMLGEAE